MAIEHERGRRCKHVQLDKSSFTGGATDYPSKGWVYACRGKTPNIYIEPRYTNENYDKEKLLQSETKFKKVKLVEEHNEHTINTMNALRILLRFQLHFTKVSRSDIYCDQSPNGVTVSSSSYRRLYLRKRYLWHYVGKADFQTLE